MSVIDPRISSEPRADNGSPDFPDDPSINQLTTLATINNLDVDGSIDIGDELDFSEDFIDTGNYDLGRIQ